MLQEECRGYKNVAISMTMKINDKIYTKKYNEQNVKIIRNLVVSITY